MVGARKPLAAQAEQNEGREVHAYLVEGVVFQRRMLQRLRRGAMEVGRLGFEFDKTL